MALAWWCAVGCVCVQVGGPGESSWVRGARTHTSQAQAAQGSKRADKTTPRASHRLILAASQNALYRAPFVAPKAVCQGSFAPSALRVCVTSNRRRNDSTRPGQRAATVSGPGPSRARVRLHAHTHRVPSFDQTALLRLGMHECKECAPVGRWLCIHSLAESILVSKLGP